MVVFGGSSSTFSEPYFFGKSLTDHDCNLWVVSSDNYLRFQALFDCAPIELLTNYRITARY